MVAIWPPTRAPGSSSVAAAARAIATMAWPGLCCSQGNQIGQEKFPKRWRCNPSSAKRPRPRPRTKNSTKASGEPSVVTENKSGLPHSTC